MTSSDHHHASFLSAFPPDRETFASGLMLSVARGTDSHQDLADHIEDVIGAGDFEASFPDEPELTLVQALAVLDEVVAEHNRMVPQPHPSALTLLSALDALAEDRIAVSFGEGFDADEGAYFGYQRALEFGETAAPRSGIAGLFRRGRGAPVAHGYTYAHTQDLDRVVFTGTLLLGFSAMTGDLGEEAAAVGATVAGRLREAGLEVDWDGSPLARIEVRGLRWERPFSA